MPHEPHIEVAAAVVCEDAAAVVAATTAVHDTVVSAACLSYCIPALRDIDVVVCGVGDVAKVVANIAVNVVVVNCIVCCRIVWMEDLNKECVVVDDVACSCYMYQMDDVCLIGKD